MNMTGSGETIEWYTLTKIKVNNIHNRHKFK